MAEEPCSDAEHGHASPHACVSESVGAPGDGPRSGEAECGRAGGDTHGSRGSTVEVLDGWPGRRRVDQDNGRSHASHIVLSLLTGGRTEELRALRWEHVHLDGHPERNPPVPSYIEEWRSVRPGGDTKIRRSRRTLALPLRCIEGLKKQRAQQAADRLAAGASWQETGLVFATSRGTAMDAANVRRDFRRALKLVSGLDPEEWTPRELRHSFVSVLSDAGVPLEESRGWSGTATQR